MHELRLHQLLPTVGRLHLTHSVCTGQVSVGAFIWGGIYHLQGRAKISLRKWYSKRKIGILNLFFFTFFYDEDVERGMMVPKEEGSFCSPSPAASLPSGSVLPGGRGCSKGDAPLRSSVPEILERDTVFHICTR